MHLALVVYSHYSRDARVRRYVESLARQGFSVDVISLEEEYRPKDKKINLIQYPLFRKRYGKLWYVVEYILFFIYAFFQLFINHFRKGYKVIHINNMPDFLVFAASFPKIFGAKVILDMHDPMPELYMSKYHATDSSLIVKLLRFIESRSFNFADEILTANSEFKRIFLTRNHISPGKIKVILNCPDERIFQRSRRKKSKYFIMLYMGTVEERFGLDIAIEALPGIMTKVQNIRFIIIPKLKEEGSYFTRLKEKIRNLHLSKYVMLGSPLPLEKIVDQINTADIGIVLAKNGIFTENIFPVKLLEFIQMEVPVIATKTKILAKYFDKDQICFLTDNTTEEFGETVITLRQDKEYRERLAQKAKSFLMKYSWKKEEAKYLSLIRSL